MSNVHQQSKKLVDTIEQPEKLTDQQVQLAKNFAQARIQEGFSIGSWCSDVGISTKTWYGWKEDADFMDYLNQVQDSMLPEDAVQAYENIKKKVIQLASKQGTTSIKEVQLFNEMFPAVVESDRRKQLEELGLNADGKEKGKERTPSVEERKANLLGKLMSGKEDK
ncbi:phBC6A51 family helix-turn-helix protein [Halobacillus litoralis]|uniref:phBC6A51 family helix-turn-helix protein n=1 Tax=Halobacillus litoralis TaxID=45668 RepID=UPI001CD2DDB8|nr:phBC6A51 family helix-turn-helix protein [Halobacillus litoralis]MCA1024282.1 hypothetical protein [Halobacillus litoralis]